jgi:hypothetical protein
VDDRQEGSDAASVADALASFKAAKKVDGRRAALLDMAVDESWVQEYAAE